MIGDGNEEVKHDNARLVQAESKIEQLQNENITLARKHAKEKKRVMELIDEIKQLQDINDLQRVQFAESAAKVDAETSEEIERLRAQLAE